MYFTDAMRVLLRRWYVVLAGIAVLGLVAFGVVRWVPTQYQATANLLLVLPADATGTAGPTNPYLNLQEGLSTTASIISTSVGTKDTQRSLAEQGDTADYSIELLPGTGPIILVTSKSTDPADAIKTRDAIIDKVDQKLADLQSRVTVPRDQVIRALPNDVDNQAEALPGSKIKALGAAGAAVIVLTLIVAFTLDGWLRKRRSKDSDSEQDTTGTDVTPLQPSNGAWPQRPDIVPAAPRRARIRGDAARRAPRRAQQVRR